MVDGGRMSALSQEKSLDTYTTYSLALRLKKIELK
jgi:hypothetical protein